MDGIRAEVLILIFRKFRNYSEIEDNWKEQLCKCQKLGDGRRLDGQRFLELAQELIRALVLTSKLVKFSHSDPFPDTLSPDDSQLGDRRLGQRGSRRIRDA